jgi:hypothetical protein
VIQTFDPYIAVFEREDAAALKGDPDAWVDAVRENRRLHERLADTTAAFGAVGLRRPMSRP